MGLSHINLSCIIISMNTSELSQNIDYIQKNEEYDEARKARLIQAVSKLLASGY